MYQEKASIRFNESLAELALDVFRAELMARTLVLNT